MPKKVDPTLHAEPGVEQRRNAVNTAWRRLTRDRCTGSLVIQARELLRQGSVGGAFLALVKDVRQLVEGYVRDYFVGRNKLARSSEEAKRMAEEFYDLEMIAKLKKELPSWRPGKPHFHVALARWVTEAFQRYQRRKIASKEQEFYNFLGQQLLGIAMQRLEQYQRAHPANCHHAILSLMERHPDDDDMQLALHLEEAGFHLGPGALRGARRRAKLIRAKFLYECVQDLVFKEGGDDSLGTLRDYFERLGLMAYLPEPFQKKYFDLGTY